MKIEVKNLPKSKVELVITITVEEIKPYLEKAAKHLSDNKDIKGFRRGHAPYDKVIQEFGEMALYEASLERIVQSTYFSAVKEKELDVIGMPEINVTKMAPGNDIEYKAVAALLPKVDLPSFEKIKVEKKEKEVEEKEVEDTLENLRKMQGTEEVKSGPSTKEDKVVIDMDLLIDNVLVEGGQTKDHGVYLNENYYVPGLPEQLIGVKKDEEKEFDLEFPKEHYQKHLAGKKVHFKVKVKDVFERKFPELNDEFAKKLGQENVAKLREVLKQNLQAEADRKENERQEIEMLEAIITKAKFEDIPDVLIDAEKRRIFAELKSRISGSGLTMEQYLEGVKKTEAQLIEEYADQADKRVKTTLVLRALSAKENIEVSDAEVEKEVEEMKKVYAKQPEVLKNLETQDTRESLKVILRNRKAVMWLKERIVK